MLVNGNLLSEVPPVIHIVLLTITVNKIITITSLNFRSIAEAKATNLAKRNGQQKMTRQYTPLMGQQFMLLWQVYCLSWVPLVTPGFFLKWEYSGLLENQAHKG